MARWAAEFHEDALSTGHREINGFRRVFNGDVYYIGPFGHLIWLYSGSEWFSDKAPAHCKTLKECVGLVASLAAELL